MIRVTFTLSIIDLGSLSVSLSLSLSRVSLSLRGGSPKALSLADSEVCQPRGCLALDRFGPNCQTQIPGGTC